MKRTALIALALGGIFMAASCSKKEAKTETPEVKKEVEQPVQDETIFRGFDLKKSLLNKGNNYRIKKVIQKIKNGEDVYVASIGGSITEGECSSAAYTNGYAYQFPKLLQETFAAGKENVHFVVAGVSGTPSPLGLIRYKKDVVEKLGHTPDILVIEFFVNDWLECTNTGAFEQLIREVLEASDEAAVIALYSVASYGNQKGQASPVASYYKIQEVDMTEAKSIFGYWTQDKVHPSVMGHSIMAQSLIYMMKEIDKDNENVKIEIPLEYKNSGDGKVNFCGYKSLLFGDENGNGDIKNWNVGSFSESNGVTQGLKVGGTEFPENWTHKSGSEKFSFTINCKNMIVAYKNNGGGKAEIFVDGKKAEFKSGDKVEAFIDGGVSGWNNISTSLIFNETTAANHKIEIKMVEGDEDKEFVICGFGYSK